MIPTSGALEGLKTHRAGVAELADALDLGSSGYPPWGFESPLSQSRFSNTYAAPSENPVGGRLASRFLSAWSQSRSMVIVLIALRHQFLVLQRQQGRRRVQLRPADRVTWVVLSRLWPRWPEALLLVKPETVIAWHRRGFRWYWCGKRQKRLSARPAVPGAVIDLITAMHRANPTWGAPRIHEELLKLG
jgi:hypothetical protein